MAHLKVLVIDNDPQTAETLAISFGVGWLDCDVASARSGEDGVLMAETATPDVIVAEAMLPDMHGLDVVRKIRLFSEVPIMIASQKADELVMVKALGLGADDFVTKPLQPLLFMARTRAILRRANAYHREYGQLPCLVSGDLTLDFTNGRVMRGGTRVDLTPTEYRVLLHLVRQAPRLVTLESMRRHIWIHTDDLQSCTVRKCVSELRRKIGDLSRNSPLIVNERAKGYRFAMPVHVAQLPPAS